MLKFSVLLLVFSAFVKNETNAFGLNEDWVSWLSHDLWRQNVLPSTLNRTECVFFRNASVLSCAGFSNSLVECPAVLNFTGLDVDVFHSFLVGVGVSEGLKSTNLFHLYPLLRDYPFHLVSQFAFRGVTTQFLLGNSTSGAFGVQVTDPVCYGNLLNVLRSWNTNQVLTLKSFDVVKPTVLRLSDLYIV